VAQMTNAEPIWSEHTCKICFSANYWRRVATELGDVHALATRTVPPAVSYYLYRYGNSLPGAWCSWQC